MKSMITVGLLAALAAAPIASAQADVIYSITQISPSYGNPASNLYLPTAPISTNLLVIATDEAAAQGFSAGFSSEASTPRQFAGA